MQHRREVGAPFRGAVGLAKGTARHARQAWLDRGELVVRDTGLRIVDPILADWVRYRFPL